MIEKMLNWLASRQNLDGSWNEVHPRYSKPSALATSFIAEAFLVYQMYPHDNNRYDTHLKKARDYVLTSELAPGFFKKSELYYADYLNVDASCGAFLAEYGLLYRDDVSLQAAARAAKNCAAHQTSDGVYPYTTREGGQPERYPFHIPCIHYQGVTIYYLIKIQKIIKDADIASSLRRATEWLADTQHADGRFDWSKSGLMFAYYLTGAYAFAAASFDYSGMESNLSRSLNVLEKNAPYVVLRWEKDHLLTYPLSIYPTIKASMIGDYPARHRFFRLGYGLYRQYARRRYSDKIEDGIFNILSKVLKINSSTIDPTANYPDLFMTSEILDCLGYVIECSRQNQKGYN